MWASGVVEAQITTAGLGHGLLGVEIDLSYLINRQSRSTKTRIKASGYGPYFVIDCAQSTSPGEAAIYELDERRMSYGSERVADGFGTFVLEHVNEYLTHRT